MLEQSATLAAAEQQEEPLQRRLSGLPPPVAAYLQAALGGPRAGSQHKIAHLHLTGHMRFLPSSNAAMPSLGAATDAAAAGAAPSPATRKWHSGKVEAYISAQPPSLVCSATIGLGPLSWVKGFVSLPAQGGGGAWQWKLCSMMRMQDLGGAGGTPAGLDQSALAAHLALAPLFPPALLPSQAVHWRAVNDTSAEATLSLSGSEASAVYTFDRLGQIVAASMSGRSPQAPAAAAATAAGTAGAAQRGAGSVAVPPGGQRSDAGAAILIYYRRHGRRCGMMVPGEIEAVAGGSRDAGGESFAHFDVASLSAWESLEGAPPLS
ncbi:hypothetical protein C2E21_1357 [Chlorella sorokiniana]|uniref:Uncharacterized protein n=1 Tax=Chlorella sorokiniana TaxID=3076 RepID=A0A2P6TZX8_CHLSO|nr:hypothetical protein C2E21_1357 [Chlorella sorokiniana]|eukprot:PRW59624.1 hypothetical protein C2E21_1357 [Chlorella sorokiniana]